MSITPIVIAAGAWLWDKYGKAVADKATTAVKDRWEKFRWDDAAEKYRNKIKRLYGTMQIMGMASPVPLDELFTDVYMLDKLTAFGRFDILKLKIKSGDPPPSPPKAKRINGIRLVEEKGNLFILGKPGAGKTTFLKYIALRAAEQSINKVPIFISLKEWADSGSDLLPFISGCFDKCDFPEAELFVEELLRSGNAIVLFDGLDEVNQESGQRDKQIYSMNSFIEKYDRTQCLVTCRIAASDYSFKPFTYAEIADFTETQSEMFVARWFRNDSETCRKFLTEFAKPDGKGLRDLARTPLLLTLLCLSFNETLSFPQRRVEIYEEALDALLKKWDSSRRIKRDEVYHKLSLGHKENLLSCIARETFERNEYFISQRELERLITEYMRNVPPHNPQEATDGEAILKAIEAQHGIFVERARKVYSFSHLTFQEYFTARQIVYNAPTSALTNFVTDHLPDGRWREVFLLTTSLLADATHLMKLCRRRLDELLENQPGLQSLFEQVVNMSNAIQPDTWELRIYYLYTRTYYRSDSISLDRSLDRSLVRALASTRDNAVPRALAEDVSRSLNNFSVRAHGTTRLRRRGTSERALFDHARTREIALSDLANELTKFSSPPRKNALAQWENYADGLRRLIMSYGEGGNDYKLLDEEELQLETYLDATALVQDCLELAFMKPDEKMAIMRSLFKYSSSVPNPAQS